MLEITRKENYFRTLRLNRNTRTHIIPAAAIIAHSPPTTFMSKGAKGAAFFFMAAMAATTPMGMAARAAKGVQFTEEG